MSCSIQDFFRSREPLHSLLPTPLPAHASSSSKDDFGVRFQLARFKDLQLTEESVKSTVGQLEPSHDEHTKAYGPQPALQIDLLLKRHDPNLETLPPELRHHILSELDLDSLGALVHASPVYHMQYSLDSKSLLFKAFMKLLSGAALDAQMAFHSSSSDFLQTRSKESVAKFLKSYVEHRTSTPWLSPHGMSSDGTASDKFKLNDVFTMDDVLSMIQFHNSVVKPLASHYADWALENLIKVPCSKVFAHPLSDTEQARFFRALYRYQMFANLFGHRRGIDENFARPDFDAEYILSQLRSLYEPWEIEELTCITVFFERMCTEVLTALQWDFDKDRPRGDVESSEDTSDLEDQSEDEWENDSGIFRVESAPYLEGLLSQGLRVLNDVFFRTKDESSLVSALKETMVYRMEGGFLGTAGHGPLGLDALDDEKYIRAPTKKELRQRRRDPLPFQGEQTMDPDGVYPPYAWTLLWMGTYSNRIGDDLRPEIQSWGYVFWDAFRMKCIGAKEVLDYQWPSYYWDQYDPRRHLDSDGRVIPGSDD